MSQEDCLDWLKKQYSANPDKWFRVKDVKEGLRQEGKSEGVIKNVGKHLLILTNWNDLDMRGVGVWEHFKEFRVKLRHNL